MGLFRWVRWAVGLGVIAMAGLFAVDQWRSPELRRLESEVRRLEQQKTRLLNYARQLSASRRVAQIDVARQTTGDSGCRSSELVWREIAADGTIGPTRTIAAIGDLVYFEGAVIKFSNPPPSDADGQPSDPSPSSDEHRTSLVLFRRVFGDCQMPISVAELDRATPIAPMGTAPPPPHASFLPSGTPTERGASTLSGTVGPTPEDELWTLFWRIVDDPRLARTYGVRVAQIEAPAVPVREGDVWEITLDAIGGLNVRKLGTRSATPEPVSLRRDRQ